MLSSDHQPTPATSANPQGPVKDRFGNYALRMDDPGVLDILGGLDAGVQLSNVSHEWLSVLRDQGWSPEYVGRNEAKEPVYFIRHQSSTAPRTFHTLPSLQPRITSGHIVSFIDGRLLMVDDRTKPRWVVPGGCRTAADGHQPATTARREFAEETRWLEAVSVTPVLRFEGQRPLLGVKGIADHCHVFAADTGYDRTGPDASEAREFLTQLRTKGSVKLQGNAEIDRVGLLPVPPLPKEEFKSLVQVVAWAKTWPDQLMGKPVSLFSRVCGAVALSKFEAGPITGKQMQEAGLARPSAKQWWCGNL